MIVKAMMLNVIVIFRSDCESNDVVESKEIMLVVLIVKANDVVGCKEIML